MITAIKNKEEYDEAVARLEALAGRVPGSEEEAEYTAIVLSMKIYNLEKYEGSETFSFSQGITQLL